MQVYSYDAVTKEYNGITEAQENPMCKGAYLMPANTTTIELPEHKDGFAMLFNGNGWSYAEDHRGQIQVNLDTLQLSEIKYIGEVLKGYQILSNGLYEDFIAYPDKYKVVDGVFQSIVGTDEWGEHLKQEFEKDFVVTSLGAIRINTAWGNFMAIKPNYDVQVLVNGFLPADCLILYKVPENFKDFENIQALSDWLVTNGQYKNKQLSKEEYQVFSNEILAKLGV